MVIHVIVETSALEAPPDPITPDMAAEALAPNLIRPTPSSDKPPTALNTCHDVVPTPLLSQLLTVRPKSTKCAIPSTSHPSGGYRLSTALAEFIQILGLRHNLSVPPGVISPPHFATATTWCLTRWGRHIHQFSSVTVESTAYRKPSGRIGVTCNCQKVRLFGLRPTVSNIRSTPAAKSSNRDQGDSRGASWRLKFLLQSTADPSLLVAAEQAWTDDGSLRRWLDRPQMLLLTG